MAKPLKSEPLDAATDEYTAVFSPGWKPGTLSNYTFVPVWSRVEADGHGRGTSLLR